MEETKALIFPDSGPAQTIMADKRSREEILESIRQEDATKDVPISSAVAIAVLAAISSVAGTVACLSIGFLEIYRQDVIAFWMACIPFCFPFITGIAIAYRKKLSCVGVHVSLLLATLLTGGAGYGYSIDPVFINRKNCKVVSEDRGNCDKETLLYLYIINGGVALAFNVIGLVYSLVTCRCATKRKHTRENMEHVEHEKQLEVQRRASRKSSEKVTYAPASWPGSFPAESYAPVKPDIGNGSVTCAASATKVAHERKHEDHPISEHPPRAALHAHNAEPASVSEKLMDAKSADATTHL